MIMIMGWSSMHKAKQDIKAIMYAAYDTSYTVYCPRK